MDTNLSEESEALEVTVDVVPQTVTEIIYLRESDLGNDASLSSSEEETDNLYQIGSVDIDSSNIENCSLMVDQNTQSVVLISSDFMPEETLYLEQVETESEINEHSDVGGFGDYKCNLCHFKCRSASSLTAHRKIHRGNFTKCQYNCKVCGRKFEKAQMLSHHFRVTHQKPKITCKICGCECSHELALINHYKNHEPKEFSCDECEAEYNNYKDLENHKVTHVTDLLYACNKCDKSFSSTQGVSNHLRIMHGKYKYNLVSPPNMIVDEGDSTNNGCKKKKV